MVTVDRVRELLDYDASTGILRWRVQRGRGKPGLIAGSPHRKGYIKIIIDGKKYFAHRLAWLHYYGRWPDGMIDHINRVRTDNSITNLRDASARDNAANRKEGVSYRISDFFCPQRAYEAYCAAAMLRFGDRAVLK